MTQTLTGIAENDIWLKTEKESVLDGIRVLIITSGHDATDHRIYDKLARSLKRRGADVTIVGKLEHPDPGEVKIIRIPRPSSRIRRFLLQPWRCLWAARHCRPDIIHFHDAEMLITFPLLKIFRHRCKLIYDVHEDFANLMLIRDWLPIRLKRILRPMIDLVEKKLSLLADAIVGVTPPLAEKFRNRNRVSALNFLTRDFFDVSGRCSRDPQMREYDLVHLGTLNRKRAVFLTEILRRFSELRPTGKALIIGASPDISGELRQVLPANCVIMNEVSYHEIPRLLGNAKVGLDVHPWLGPHLMVALPVKICEYMASDCAVVASSLPVLETILDKDEKGLKGIRVISGDQPADYVEAVVALLSEIEKGAHPGRELRHFALRHMIWENEAEKIVHLYLKLLGKSCAI